MTTRTRDEALAEAVAYYTEAVGAAPRFSEASNTKLAYITDTVRMAGKNPRIKVGGSTIQVFPYGSRSFSYAGAATAQQTLQRLQPPQAHKSPSLLNRTLRDEVVHIPGPPRPPVPADDYDKPDWLYWVVFPTGEVKFGRSHNPKDNRLARYQTCFSTPLEFAALVKCSSKTEGKAMEQKLMRRWEKQGFKLTGGGDELFTTDILPSYVLADLVDGYVVPRDAQAVAA